jgi:hypothetical protein
VDAGCEFDLWFGLWGRDQVRGGGIRGDIVEGGAAILAACRGSESGASLCGKNTTLVQKGDGEAHIIDTSMSSLASAN